jgi:hypothetical protein
VQSKEASFSYLFASLNQSTIQSKKEYCKSIGEYEKERFHTSIKNDY